MRNDRLLNAKKAKKNEFYTQYEDIEKEINSYLDFDADVFKNKIILLPCDDPEWSNFTKYFAQNFEKLQLKKLISTSYAPDSKEIQLVSQPTLFEQESPNFDIKKFRVKGKIFTIDSDINRDKRIDYDDLDWKYLEGDGDFRSTEVSLLRDEADFIITNPPFSLWREFLEWIISANKGFSIIGNMNAVGNKEVFPLFMDNKLWLGPSISSGDREFQVPMDYPLEAAGFRVDETGNKFIRIKGVRWFTNIEHGRRHQPISLMTLEDNLKFSKHKEIRGKSKYIKFDNYDAIEIPFTDAIPSDYDGVMGVPISFLDKYSPEQFELLGSTQRGCHDRVPDTRKYDDYWEVTPEGTPTGSSGGKTNENANILGNDGKKNYFINKKGRIVQSAYQRIFIRHRRVNK